MQARAHGCGVPLGERQVVAARGSLLNPSTSLRGIVKARPARVYDLGPILTYSRLLPLFAGICEDIQVAARVTI